MVTRGGVLRLWQEAYQSGAPRLSTACVNGCVDTFFGLLIVRLATVALTRHNKVEITHALSSSLSTTMITSGLSSRFSLFALWLPLSTSDHPCVLTARGMVGDEERKRFLDSVPSFRVLSGLCGPRCRAPVGLRRPGVTLSVLMVARLPKSGFR